MQYLKLTGISTQNMRNSKNQKSKEYEWKTRVIFIPEIPTERSKMSSI